MSSLYELGEKMKKILPYVMIAFGAALWGLIAIFVRELKESGFSEMEIVTIRVTFASIFLLIIGAIGYRQDMTIQFRKIPLFVGTGILSIVFFNWCYFSAINEMSVSLAVILLYTSPAFVTILSFFFLKEPLHGKKILAVIGTIMGCVLIAGFSTDQTTSVSVIGVLTGLGAGLGYALYSIFGKFALRHYKPFTVTLYTFIVAAVALLPFSGIWSKLDILFTGRALFYSIGLALIPTVLAYFIYTWGLEKTESSVAAVIATVEPIVATIVGILIYQEKLGLSHVSGAILILLSVILINIPSKHIKNHQNLEKIKSFDSLM